MVAQDLIAAVEWIKGERDRDEHVEAGFFAVGEAINFIRFVPKKKKGA